MSLLHIRHIKTYNEKYRPLINMDDHQGSPEEKDKAFHSRALAAFAVATQAGIEPAAAAASIIDGFNDNGVDSIYFDQKEKVLYITQSKFFQTGKGGPEQGDVMKFCRGIRELIEATYTNFNDKLSPLIPQIQLALDDTQTRIRAILVTTGDSVSDHVKTEINRLLEEVNDPSEYIKFSTYGISDVHGWLSDEATAADISFELLMREWGKIERPLQLIYGQVNCLELVEIYDRFISGILNRNIRGFLCDTEISADIEKTASNNPETFIYFNNGITILCESIEKTVKGGGNRDSGTFKCNGAQIVNGAQTIGSLHRAKEANRSALEKAFVLVRLISVAGGAADLATDLTRATNTQNRVEKKDFVTLDPTQERLRRELLLDNIQYIYKAGDRKVLTESITLDEATSALACASGDLNFAILAKKEIGKLWERTDAPPYALLFPSDISAEILLHKVRICRRVEEALLPFKLQRGDQRNLVVHGNRVIQYMVITLLSKAIIQNSKASFEAEVDTLTIKIVNAMNTVKSIVFQDALLGRLFYNQSKTLKLVNETMTRLIADT